MSDTFGRILQLTTFGESHGKGIGCVISGLEPRFEISLEKIKEDLARRRGGVFGTTGRVENDEFEIISGLYNGKTTGTALAAIIKNENCDSSEYKHLENVFRPGHADKTYMDKYGIRDPRGGGRASGRETAARVFAGAICKQILASHGINVRADIISIGGINAEETDKVHALLEKAKKDNNSVGGKVRCVVRGAEAGLGEPVFNKADALISYAIMGIGAVKGIEFGSGFASEALFGTENNREENAGGILGGITNGRDIVFNAVIKPTPTVKTGGRHDVCIALRIAPVIEAMTAVAILDLYYIRHGNSSLSRR